jgi:hypothetical protein
MQLWTAGQGRNLPFKWSFESIDALAGYKPAYILTRTRLNPDTLAVTDPKVEADNAVVDS